MSLKFIITCEHASHRVPVALEPHLIPWMDRVEEHLWWDPGAAAISRAMTGTLQAPCFEGRWTRLLVDLNRSTHHRQLHGPPVASLSRDRRDAIVQRFYRPFRDTVSEAVARAIVDGFQVVHLSVHSFVPVFCGVDRRTDFALLYDPRRTGERTLARNWLKRIHLEQPEWRLRSNHPYRGTADGHTTGLRKLWTEENYLGIELEFSQGLPLTSHSRRLGRRMALCLWAALHD